MVSWALTLLLLLGSILALIGYVYLGNFASMKKCLWCVLILALSGCHHSDPIPAEATPVPVAATTDSASIKLAEAAASVSRSLTDLDAVEKANMAPKAAKLYPKVAEMTIPGVSSIDWNGPIRPLLKQIADAAGYRLKVYGNEPIVPIIVAIHAREESNADIVRDAALQAGARAAVITNCATKVIELHYRGTDK